MILHTIKKAILPLSLLALYACTKVINVDLNNAAPQIVIEGIITNTPGPYQVQITKTVNFSESNTFPPVTGATVTIIDKNAGITDVLSETSAGIYTTHTIQGIPGRTYQLNISTGGQTYTASSTMPQPVTLDSVTFQHTDRLGNLDITNVPNYQDPAVIKNYYSFDQTVNGRKIKTTSVFDDRLSDGKYISLALRNDSTYIKLGDTVTVKMNCIDKSTYDYFYTLVQVSGGSNFRSSASPSNPVSNISNNALGYFTAFTTQTKKLIAK